MKNALTIAPALRKRLARERALIFFDFDGTLAPIAPTPERARMPAHTRALLGRLAAQHRVIVVSGRALRDAKAKVGLNIDVAGNHGLEWHVAGRRGHAKLTSSMQKDLRNIRTQMRALLAKYPGARFEDKQYTISLHYRLVPPTKARALIKETLRVLAPFMRLSRIRVTRGKEVLDVRPAIAWHKGDFARMVIRRLQRPRTVVFIGDDATDEDAFRALTRDITIRVGRARASAARFYVRDRADVDRFLEAISPAA